MQRILGALAALILLTAPAFADVSEHSTENPKVAAAPAHMAQKAHRAAKSSHRAKTVKNPISAPPALPAGSSLVSTARSYLGTNPTSRRSLWCGAFMDLVLRKTGHKAGGNLARAYSSYGRHLSGPVVGALAVMSRGKGGGHVGVVSGITAKGDPIIISGNHNNTVAEAVYPRGRIIAYVDPSS